MKASLTLLDALFILIAVAAAFYLVPDVRERLEESWWDAIQAGVSEDIKSILAVVVILAVLAYLLLKFFL
jgi:hypothetical protein